MRILYFYSSQQFNSGSPKVLVSMIDALDRERVEPVFWARGEGPLVSELEARGVEILRRPADPLDRRHPLQSLKRARSQAAALRAARINLLHVNEYSWNLDLVLGAWLARIPVILHAHNPVSVERWNLDRIIAARVLFVSRAHRDAVLHLGRLGSRAGILYNPLDLERYAGGVANRDSLGLRPEHFVVLSVGQIEERKGFDLLLDVAQVLVPRYPLLRFVIAGDPKSGHEEYAERLMRRAAVPPFDDRVKFLGSRTDVPDLLASADLFAFPSRHETFGLVVGEAMAAALPVVTTDVGGIPEVVGPPDAAVLLPKEDAPGFVREIERLILDQPARLALAARGKAAVTSRFGTGSFANELLQLYHEVLSG